MTIYSAMNSGVAGLAAQSTKFGAISDNISNSSTIGYKRTDVQFATMVTSTTIPGSYSAGGLQTDVRSETTIQGTVQSTSTSTDLAISGSGFFVVSSAANADVTKASEKLLTRSGSFRVDEQGNLVNAAGYFLQGWALDSNGKVIGGEPSRTSFTTLQTVNLADITGMAQATNNIEFSANLPASATGQTPAAGSFSTSIDYFTPLGFTKQLTLEWQPSTVANQWRLNIKDSAGASIGSVNMAFSNGIASTLPAGTLSSMTSGTAGVTVTGGTISLSVGGQPITIKMGDIGRTGGLTQWGDQYVPSKISKDGASYASLDRVQVGKDGIITAIYGNGLRKPVYQLPLATVINADGLTSVAGNAYKVSRESGDIYLWDSGSGSTGTISGGALEASNVDIAKELTSIIETQRAYSSCAKIIKTADEMLEQISMLMR
ncbi:flagellar hook protein FlgE [Niveispirillum sp. BGYR6]|uniref:flagellar hook protein FlgE n=1 Tax=Niveispirillum sp. BGYR6 TaxID=2971249 RepID=UPI0022B99EE3|nr:flagellar hook protein FlgE [Niveispirillum sp. BGYR6]MDG5496329.1 flagellar hook protein FlgE [Niveispirillum sp. BGYR6]